MELAAIQPISAASKAKAAPIRAMYRTSSTTGWKASDAGCRATTIQPRPW